MTFTIEADLCFLCGKKLGKRENHHAIPKCLKPKFNIKLPIHGKCHDKINKLYVSEEKIVNHKKIKNILKVALVGLNKAYEKVSNER